MKRYLLLVILLIPVLVKAQQDPQFSQYLFHGVVINPAYAGSREYVNVNALYRKQWRDANGSPSTQLISGDIPLFNNHIGIGVYAYNDELGAQFKKAFYGSFAYRIKISQNSRLAFGVSTGINQLGIDGSKLVTDQPNDPSIPVGRVSEVKPNFQLGLYLNSDRYFAGVSMSDIVSHDYDDFEVTTERRHFYLSAGFVSALSESFKIRPSFLIKEDFKAPTNGDITAFLIFKDKIWLGSSYRTRIINKGSLNGEINSKDAVVFMLQVFPIDNLRIGYGYDLTINDYSNFSTHEFSLGYNLDWRKNSKMLSPRYF